MNEPGGHYVVKYTRHKKETPHVLVHIWIPRKLISWGSENNDG